MQQRLRLCQTCRSLVHNWWKSRRTSEKYGTTNKPSSFSHVWISRNSSKMHFWSGIVWNFFCSAWRSGKTRKEITLKKQSLFIVKMIFIADDCGSIRPCYRPGGAVAHHHRHNPIGRFLPVLHATNGSFHQHADASRGPQCPAHANARAAWVLSPFMGWILKTFWSIQIYLHFSSFLDTWDGGDSWNPSPWKRGTCLSYVVNTVAADELAMQGVEASAKVLSNL